LFEGVGVAMGCCVVEETGETAVVAIDDVDAGVEFDERSVAAVDADGVFTACGGGILAAEQTVQHHQLEPVLWRVLLLRSFSWGLPSVAPPRRCRWRSVVSVWTARVSSAFGPRQFQRETSG
jgi:hypothetical protein